MAPKSLSEWFRSTRLAQQRADGRPWSQDDFVAALEDETGYRLYRTNYSTYETGATTPEPETVAKLLAFWEGRGIVPPEFPDPEQQETPPDLPTALMALATELRESRAERERMATEVADLRALVDGLVERALGAEPKRRSQPNSAGSAG